MALLGHGTHTPAEREDPRLITRNARYGLWLFSVYLVIYGTFVIVNAFTPQVMATSAGGVNLAVVYGMGLIATAMVLALIYTLLCRRGLPVESRAVGHAPTSRLADGETSQ
uniref:DUF485 domain-containing protein n=1 Tax=Schlesneria paludicola TaxID=360056 RepID=A0A7C4QTC8_9PLAN